MDLTSTAPFPTQFLQELDNGEASNEKLQGVNIWNKFEWHKTFYAVDNHEYTTVFITLICGLCGLVGNSIFFWLVGFRVKRSPFSTYVFNLATADIIFLCFLTFLSTVKIFHIYLPFSTYTGLVLAETIADDVGLGLLAAISTECCLSEFFPIWYQRQRPKYTSIAVCIWFWVLAFLLLTLNYVICNNSLYGTACQGYEVTQAAWTVLLVSVLCVSSLTLILKVQYSSRRPQHPRFYVLVLLMVHIFLGLGLPLIIFIVGKLEERTYLSKVTPLLLCVNSSIHPFLSFFVGILDKSQKEPLRLILQRVLSDKEDPGGFNETSCMETMEMSPGRGR
ncbi:mas-related G-protein coupled receptor member X3-like [Gracilinanus agilis]|uniref:mas-related G-protein coupled receptor member X3-like n=1 Tax=Gracilinanus agilis TaxID=191870 RepID=UPI001CFDE3DA|nr:mas-related G-protein coupled receptor member X3-like [Gracilinanus agilis]